MLSTPGCSWVDERVLVVAVKKRTHWLHGSGEQQRKAWVLWGNCEVWCMVQAELQAVMLGRMWEKKEELCEHLTRTLLPVSVATLALTPSQIQSGAGGCCCLGEATCWALYLLLQVRMVKVKQPVSQWSLKYREANSEVMRKLGVSELFGFQIFEFKLSQPRTPSLSSVY